MTNLPLVGIAITTRNLPEYRDFLMNDQRDLELQDFCNADLLNGDWRGVADTAKAQLAGYTGRLGIHGPFWGLNIANPDTEMGYLVRRKHLQGLEVCEYLGATQMVIHSPYRMITSSAASIGMVMRKGPDGVSGCVAASASASAISSSAAETRASSRAPSSVGRVDLVVRASKRTPRSSSSCVTA
ncbi:hypothetical protein SAMN06265221_11757 [Paracoccus laeviglucosivorans]|uniref:Uncharacterized protein n=1 Tax=Paracoccus laeviglucosivorans TaxID=1197861 RepID=A0A521F270_9RHOB|nr:hypothetical protein [Paracoccus laeviglucosivorans]SMO90263.1 hypothetical protein SAMN06265221_11757 [Paracoccus laeviglucosivorans]